MLLYDEHVHACPCRRCGRRPSFVIDQYGDEPAVCFYECFACLRVGSVCGPRDKSHNQETAVIKWNVEHMDTTASGPLGELV